MNENEPIDELKLIQKTLNDLPVDLTPELICNLFANIIVGYGLFDQVAEITAGTIACAIKVYEEQQTVLH